MSSRSFNRALGHTSLELKCLFLFGVFLVVVITVNFFLYWGGTKTVVDQKNPDTGRLLARQAMLIKHYERFGTTEPDWGDRSRGFLFYVDKNLTKPLNDEGYDWRVIIPPGSYLDRNGLARPQPGFERELLDRWSKDPPDQAAETIVPESVGRLGQDGDFYEYYQAIRAEANCLKFCHWDLDPGTGVFDPTGSLLGGGMESMAEGDLMAMVWVKIPNAPTRDAINEYWSKLLAAAIITAFLGMAAFYVTIRYVIVRPLKHLRDVSNAISHGNMAMRAELSTGDEFEALGVAFNRMLRHLVTIQDELRRANTRLDGKVDELAQLNMQLYEMNRVKSDFMATMSHELRTPLNSILGFSDVLASADALKEKQKRFVQNIQKSGQMLLEMINNILDMAKIESGRIEIQLTDFDIGQVVGTQCDMARPLTERKNIDLETVVQPGLPSVYQDQGRVHQILNNLLSNAIKFTPEGGRIRVTAGRSGRQELVLKVIDTGVGIADEDQQTIFEKFRQGTTALPGSDAFTREYSGTGLGLSIVRELCKLLGGDVSVESELGTGTTFTVRLPWKLQKQPRLDSPLATGLEEFVRPRFDPKSEGVLESVSSAPRLPGPEDDG